MLGQAATGDDEFRRILDIGRDGSRSFLPITGLDRRERPGMVLNRAAAAKPARVLAQIQVDDGAGLRP
jgi:hypothetical protein